MERYSEVSVLNQGSYGVVQLVRHAQSGKLYAAKRVSLALSSRSDVEAEIRVHERVASHSKVVRLVDFFEDAERNDMVLIMEYCPGGDLHDLIASGKRPSTAETRRIMLQLIDLMEFCHSVGVYHRDVKPENILLHRHASIKLGDWGLATTSRHCTDFGTGSEQYMAPECFDRAMKTYDAAKADIWAVGIVLLNLLFGRNPFTQATARDRLFTDFASSREALYDMFPSLSADVFAVLRHALTIDPDNRDLGHMRRALLSVRTWTMDEEIERLEKKQSARSPLSSFGTYGTPPLSMVPVVHKPFRVPTAVARSLKSPATPWDRRMMYTPPASTSSSLHRAHRPGAPHLLLPQHAEQPEDEMLEDDGDDIFAMDSLSLDDGDALIVGALDDDDSPEEALEPADPPIDGPAERAERADAAAAAASADGHSSAATTASTTTVVGHHHRAHHPRNHHGDDVADDAAADDERAAPLLYRPPHLLWKQDGAGAVAGAGATADAHFNRFKRPLARKIPMYR